MYKDLNRGMLKGDYLTMAYDSSTSEVSEVGTISCANQQLLEFYCFVDAAQTDTMGVITDSELLERKTTPNRPCTIGYKKNTNIQYQKFGGKTPTTTFESRKSYVGDSVAIAFRSKIASHALLEGSAEVEEKCSATEEIIEEQKELLEKGPPMIAIAETQSKQYDDYQTPSKTKKRFCFLFCKKEKQQKERYDIYCDRYYGHSSDSEQYRTTSKKSFCLLCCKKDKKESDNTYLCPIVP